MKTARGPLLLLLALLVAGLVPACTRVQAHDSPDPWPKEVTDQVATIPVLASGRVKPFDTWAQFTLLRMNGVRSCRDADDNVLTPREWALDVLFRPSWARQHRCFLVVTTEVLDAIDLEYAGRKMRDRYSFEEIWPGRQKLVKIAPPLRKKSEKERTPVEEGLVRLYDDLVEFTWLTSYMDFVRGGLPVGEDPEIARLFDGRETVPFSEVLERATELMDKVEELVPEGTKPEDTSEAGLALQMLLARAYGLGQDRFILRIFPPTEDAEEKPTWFSLDDITKMAMQFGQLAPEHLRILRDLEAVGAAVGTPRDTAESIRAYHDASKSLAEERGEYGDIEREVWLYRLDPFHKALYIYILAFVLIALGWLWPGSRLLSRIGWILIYAGLLLHVYGIVLRCVIRGRPPISTLYETVLFITAVGVIVSLIVEYFNWRKIAFALAPVIGAVGLFIASRYELLERRDTMPKLQAVLDTNFWLATHVTCISIGYCAGLLAGIVAHIYVLGRFFQGRGAAKKYDPALWVTTSLIVTLATLVTFLYFGGLWAGVASAGIVGALLFLHFTGRCLPTGVVDEGFYTTVGRMVYGLVCFALLFSLVGTILGGIWANDSWGRFWGWDPKENGALLICLSQLAILHGRMGGIFKVFGVCMAAIFGACIVVFSWWGVNLLGIGLHSYGFTSGIWSVVMMVYAFEALILGAGLHAFLRDRGVGRTGGGPPPIPGGQA